MTTGALTQMGQRPNWFSKVILQCNGKRMVILVLFATSDTKCRKIIGQCFGYLLLLLLVTICPLSDSLGQIENKELRDLLAISKDSMVAAREESAQPASPTHQNKPQPESSDLMWSASSGTFRALVHVIVFIMLNHNIFVVVQVWMIIVDFSQLGTWSNWCKFSEYFWKEQLYSMSKGEFCCFRPNIYLIYKHMFVSTSLLFIGLLIITHVRHFTWSSQMYIVHCKKKDWCQHVYFLTQI